MAPLISLRSLWTLTFAEVNGAEPFGIIYRSWPVCIKISVRLSLLGFCTAENIIFLWTSSTNTGGPKITIRSALLWKKIWLLKQQIPSKRHRKEKGKENGEWLYLWTFCSPPSKLCHPQIQHLIVFHLSQHNKLQKHFNITPSVVREFLGLCLNLLWQDVVGCNLQRGRWPLHLFWISWAGSGGEMLKVSTLQWQTIKWSRRERNSTKHWSWRLRKDLETSLRSREQPARPLRQNILLRNQKGLTEHQQTKEMPRELQPSMEARRSSSCLEEHNRKGRSCLTTFLALLKIEVFLFFFFYLHTWSLTFFKCRSLLDFFERMYRRN